MANKKTKDKNKNKAAEAETTSAKKSKNWFAGVVDMFRNEHGVFILGLILLIAAVVMVISFVSYLKTGAADQSLLETPRPGDLPNSKQEFSNSCGSFGAYIAYFFIKRCFGLSAFLIPFFLILTGLRLMGAYKVNLWKWFLGTMTAMVWCSVAFAKFLSPLFQEAVFNPGGDHGAYVCQYIENLSGQPGLIALLAAVLLIFLTFVTNETVVVIRNILNPKRYLDKVKLTINNFQKDKMPPMPDTYDDDDDEEEEEPQPAQTAAATTAEPEEQEKPKSAFSNLFGRKKDKEKEKEETPEPQDIGMSVTAGTTEEKADGKVLVGDKLLDKYDPRKEYGMEHYKFPTLDLLKKYNSEDGPVIDMAEQNANKNRIVEVLRSFGVEIKEINATVGPTITLYEVIPAEGVRINKIRNLEDDIALSLAALGIRIIAPIPGKGTIGIEVPNANPQIVSMESVLNSKKFQETKMKLPMALGKTITNDVFMVDLAKIPHLLVAGATGQGKSVGLNAIITSLLYKKHPAELKFVLIDPKKVEFSVYRSIDKHFLAAIPDNAEDPIITDVTKVVRTLNSLCKEMDTRYDLLKKASVRKIDEYNEKFVARQLNPENGHRYMPYIVVIIDEFGDLIMTAGKEIELPIARIAQLARAVGIHMIIATQRPTTKIITGTIKANFPGRMAFKTSARIDSMTILDRTGANQLIGRGDMLFLNGNEPVRVQCAFVDTPEVDKINNFIASQHGYPEAWELPEPDIADGLEGSGAEALDARHLDPMFEDAARLIVSSQSGSTSLIQRKYSIGYNRAGRLMDQLEKAGIVGAAQGSKPREVLIQDESSLNMLLLSLKG